MCHGYGFVWRVVWMFLAFWHFGFPWVRPALFLTWIGLLCKSLNNITNVSEDWAFIYNLSNVWAPIVVVEWIAASYFVFWGSRFHISALGPVILTEFSGFAPTSRKILIRCFILDCILSFIFLLIVFLIIFWQLFELLFFCEWSSSPFQQGSAKAHTANNYTSYEKCFWWRENKEGIVTCSTDMNLCDRFLLLGGC